MVGYSSLPVAGAVIPGNYSYVSFQHQETSSVSQIIERSHFQVGRSSGADRLQQRPRAAGARRMPTVLYRSQRSVRIDKRCQITDLKPNAPRLFLIRRDSRVVQFRGHVDALPDLPRLRRVHQEERRVLRCVG